MRRGQKPRGPRIVSRYNPSWIVQMKVDGEIKDFIVVSTRGEAGSRRYILAPSQDQNSVQQDNPVQITPGVWLYHDYWVSMEDAHTYREDDAVLLIKRAVLREERELALARQEAETLSRLGELPMATREIIPDEVRMFVWRRDE